RAWIGNGATMPRAASPSATAALTPSARKDISDKLFDSLSSCWFEIADSKPTEGRNEKLNLTGRPDAVRPFRVADTAVSRRAPIGCAGLLQGEAWFHPASHPAACSFGTKSAQCRDGSHATVPLMATASTPWGKAA